MGMGVSGTARGRLLAVLQRVLDVPAAGLRVARADVEDGLA